MNTNVLTTHKSMMTCLKVEFMTAVCIACMLAGCGEVYTTYTVNGNSRRNNAVATLVESTAERLRLRMDKEGLSPFHRSYERGSIYFNLAEYPDAPTFIHFSDDSLLHKRDYTRIKEDLTYGLRRIDPKLQMDTRWHSSPMM